VAGSRIEWVGVTVAGAGALVGLVAGAVRAGIEIHRAAYLENGTPWLAWARLCRRASDEAVAGGALALAVAVVLCAVPAFRRALPALPRSRVASAVLGLTVLLALLAAFEGPLDRRRAAGRPSVILVSIDTLRGDRLVGPDGAARMPRLHALAAEGASFTQAMATAPWTLPSHVSLLTSLLPFDHGVRTMHSVIPPEQAMLTERFRDAGYRTAAFTGGVYVGAAFGYGQGFDHFEEHEEEKEGGPQGIFDGALRWAREARGSPFFLFVHTYHPHLPYRSAGGPRPGGRVSSLFTVADAEEVYAGRLALTAHERTTVTGLYDADVAATDAAVGGFLERLRAEGILDDAVLVVLSDHGEDLWDRPGSRSPGHGHALYQEVVHVPLVFRAPGRILPGVRLQAPVSLLDVAPTLLDLCGLPADRGYRGRSLAGALRRGAEPEAAGPQVAECVEYGPERLTVRDGPLKVILADPAVLHHGIHLPALPLEVYDLDLDPSESDPVSGRHSDRLSRALTTLEQRKGRREGKTVGAERGEPLPDEVREQLRSLGYVN
jgi:arylsulfatase A-like enzyme